MPFQYTASTSSMQFPFIFFPWHKRNRKVLISTRHWHANTGAVGWAYGHIENRKWLLLTSVKIKSKFLKIIALDNAIDEFASKRWFSLNADGQRRVQLDVLEDSVSVELLIEHRHWFVYYFHVYRNLCWTWTDAYRIWNILINCTMNGWYWIV